MIDGGALIYILLFYARLRIFILIIANQSLLVFEILYFERISQTINIKDLDIFFAALSLHKKILPENQPQHSY